MKKLKIKQKSNRSGFTLVELVITIAIVIILSVISVPIYRGYVDKSKMAEGYALLGACLSAQKAYYSQYGNFLMMAHGATTTCYDTILGIDARGNRYFTKFHAGSGYDFSYAKKYFDAVAFKSDELITDASNQIALLYNITKGSKFCDNINWDISWRD